MSPARRRVAGVADLLFVALIALGIAAAATGGLRPEIFGQRISIRSAWRVFAWAALVVGLRHLIVPRPSILSRVQFPADELVDSQTCGDSGVGVVRRSSRHWLVVAFFTIATAWMLLPQVMAPFSVPDPGDPLLSIWRLAWVAHQFPLDPVHLFDANIFYPHLRTLAYSDAMLVPGAVAAPLLWLGLHQVLVYDVIFFASLVSSGAMMFVLIRALTGRSDAALVSGLLFAFCAFRFAHYSHLELQVTPWMPLGLLWFHRTITTHRLRDGLLTGVAVALQGLSSLYYGMFFSTLLVCLTLLLSVARALDVRRAARPLVAGGLLAAVLLLPVTVPYWQNRAVVGERGESEVLYYSAVPADYLVPSPRSVYSGRQVRGRAERELFPGVVPVALALAGVVPPLSAARFAYLGALVLAVDASFGLNGVVYPLLYRYVAPFRGLRVPARFGMIVALVLSVLAGYGVARIARRCTRPMLRRLVVAGLAVVVLLEARPVLSLEPISRDAPSVYAALPANRVSVLAELPFPGPEETFGHDFTFMYFSTFHWNALVNGATGVFPEDYLVLRKVMYGFPSDEALSALEARGVEFLALHQQFYPPSEYRQTTADLERRQSVRLVTTTYWHGSEVRLYRLERTR